MSVFGRHPENKGDPDKLSSAEIRHVIVNDFRGLMRRLWEDDCVQSQHKKRILERLLAKDPDSYE
jgi:hypothetical protein